MSNVEVKAVVASITSAFSSSIDVFHRVHNSRRDKQRKDIASDEELRLTKSLHKAHRAISREYARDYGQLGQQFATGDGEPSSIRGLVLAANGNIPKAIAQTALADTLLKLNIGLVNIISAFLAGNPNNVQLDLRSLTELSDTSRKEALDALGHLYSRLTKSSTTVQQQVTRHAKPCSQDREPQSDTSRPSKNKNKAKENGTMPITGGVLPSLVNSVAYASVPVPSQRPRGAWVRSRRSSASSSVTYISAEPKWNPAPSRAVAIASTSTQKIPILPATESVPPDQTPPTQFTPKKAPPVPSKPLALQSPTPMCLIKASTSVYSFASDSTKLGEIPQHKWATPASFHGLETKDLSVTAAPPDAYTGAEGTKGKAKGKAKFLNFFRRGTASNAEVDPV
ncbi:MAG: hypothetical protein M1835_000032 [Candelina submexicana]|nr:MAG: hypothetical protein M1835_000032 [Candelina submexicana]